MSLNKIQQRMEKLSREMEALQREEEKALAAAKKPVVEKVVTIAEEVVQKLVDREFEKVSAASIRKADLARTLNEALEGYFKIHDAGDEGGEVKEAEETGAESSAAGQ